MDTTFEQTNGMRHGDGNLLKSDLKDSVKKMRAAGSQEINDLIADVEEFIGRVGESADPEIARLRTKVEQAVSTTKKSLTQGAEHVQRKAQAAIDAGDRYVRDQPWQALGVAAFAGLVLGFFVARR
jgi:ElaB/YqjD/DUF883 family membrane-anchored ribosome-binding protein